MVIKKVCVQCTDYGITFDGAGLWSFENDTAINVIIFW